LSLSAPEIEQLFAQAQAVRAAGDMAAFERQLETIIASAEHPRALNAYGNHVLNRGDATAARALLERAVAADAAAAPLWFNLSLACRVQGDSAAEIAALAQALVCDPYFIQAMVHKGQAIERSGDITTAAHFYKDALACANAQPDLAARVNPALLQIARSGVAQNAAALDTQLNDALASVRARHGHNDSARFAEMLDIFHGRSSYQLPKPTFLPFPDLPPIGFHDRADFPWLAALEQAADAMRDELGAALLGPPDGFTPYIQHGAGKPLAQWQELNHNPRWSAYHLLQNGVRMHDHIAACPKTMAVLDAAPLADVPGNAPNAFFSVLKPRTHIPPHTGMTNTRLVVHLPLIVPDHCSFRVGNHTRSWEADKAWVFDDTIEHEARNDSDDTRIILIVDIWNPLLSLLERDLIRAFFDGLGRYNEGGIKLSAGL
jgi:aspartate beta-hydroxylase